MDTTYWLKQPADQPLYPDLLWARPENKRQAGKLLIVGGNKFGFAAVGSAYGAAAAAGIGTIRVLLPDALSKTVAKLLPDAEFGPSTPSGSFSRRALETLVDASGWADGVVLAGDFGRNSETAVLLEDFVREYSGQVSLQQDALDYFWGAASPALNRPKTTFVINLGKLQKLAKNNWPGTPVLNSMSLLETVKWLHERTGSGKTALITKHAGNYLTALKGEVLTTKAEVEQPWQTELGAYVAVWRLQQPAKPLPALACAIFDYLKPTKH